MEPVSYFQKKRHPKCWKTSYRIHKKVMIEDISSTNKRWHSILLIIRVKIIFQSCSATLNSNENICTSHRVTETETLIYSENIFGSSWFLLYDY